LWTTICFTEWLVGQVLADFEVRVAVISTGGLGFWGGPSLTLFKGGAFDLVLRAYLSAWIGSNQPPSFFD
jgi:hypothetical protein